MKISKKIKNLSRILEYRVRKFKIYSLEDPVEYVIPYIKSIPVFRYTPFTLPGEVNYQKNTFLKNLLPYVSLNTIQQSKEIICKHKIQNCLTQKEFKRHYFYLGNCQIGKSLTNLIYYSYQTKTLLSINAKDAHFHLNPFDFLIEPRKRKIKKIKNKRQRIYSKTMEIRHYNNLLELIRHCEPRNPEKFMETQLLFLNYMKSQLVEY